MMFIMWKKGLIAFLYRDNQIHTMITSSKMSFKVLLALWCCNQDPSTCSHTMMTFFECQKKTPCSEPKRIKPQPGQTRKTKDQNKTLTYVHCQCSFNPTPSSYRMIPKTSQQSLLRITNFLRLTFPGLPRVFTLSTSCDQKPSVCRPCWWPKPKPYPCLP